MTGILNILAGSISSAIKDGYFNLVSLLLHGDGTNGAQNNTFIDSSSNNFTITRNGNTTQGTFSPFSQTGWGNYFDGTDDFLSVSYTATNFGTSDFTVECWVLYTSRADYRVLLDTRASASANPFIFGIQGTSGLLYFDKGTGDITASTAVPLNQWSHVAISRASGTIRMFIDGVQVYSASDSSNLTGTSTGTVNIGTSAGGTGDFIGYISNFRVVKGTGVYTGAFTPSTTPLTAISGTQLLTCQSNRFVDNSSNAFAITVNGTPSVQAFSPFAPTAAYSAATNGGSGYFDGTGDYLSVPNNAVYDLSGATSWCIETWAYWNSVSGEQNIVEKFTNPSGPGWTLYKFSSSNGSPAGSIDFYGGSAFNSGVVPTAGQWYHIVVCRDNATGRTSWFINGTRTATSTTFSIGGNAATPLVVGVRAGGATYFNGSMSGMRVVKGSSVYDPSQTSITVPTAPPTAITNTQLLLNFTNAGITDATGKNVLETVGNAQISTTQSKFGGSSMYFDGNGDNLAAASNVDWNCGTGDFTVEGWVYISSRTLNYPLVVGNNNGSYSAGAIAFTVSNSDNASYNDKFILSAYDVSNTAPALVASSTNSTATWYHFAIVRSGTTLTMYRNGTSVASATISSSVVFNWGKGGIRIGGGNWDGAQSYFNGYIDDLRITKGYARYTGNFTPPTQAFALQ